MPVKSYPFIDIAVHERVRDHFARGDAAVLFAPDLSRVLWSNGEGAALFGVGSIYDFLDAGPTVATVAFRQMQATARQLREAGEARRFMMRLSSGFRSGMISAELSLIDVRPGERAILFTAPRPGRAMGSAEAAARMISGFDDPDTHMAVLDGTGEVLASSPLFQALGMTQQTLRLLVEAVGRDSGWLLKRPVLTGKGSLPAAIGKVADDPALHLLFAVETVLGHMDATSAVETSAIVAPPVEPDAMTFAAEAAAGDVASQEDAVEEDTLETGVQAEPDDGDATAEHSEPDMTDRPDASLPLDDRDDAGETAAFGAPEDTLSGDDGQAEDPVETTDEVVAAADARQPDPEDGVGVSEADAARHESDGAALPTEALPADDVPADVEPAGMGPAGVGPVGVGPAGVGSAGVGADPVLEASDVDASVTLADATPAAGGGDADPMPRDAEASEMALTDAPPFLFDPAMRAVRFVWKIGADGRFSEISREFAVAVGPDAADVIGQSFADLAERYGLDPDRTIVDLLNRRDTWSGKTVLWPVQGAALRVPVDLAALPTYSRNREFDGFRGFGIVRVADAVEDGTFEDPDLAAIDGAVDDRSELDETAAAPSSEVTVDAVRPEIGDDHAGADVGDAARADFDLAPDGMPHDPFQGERPALKLVETPARRASDNIVQMDDVRAAPQETLTRSEQAAFREIARQLTTTFGKRTEPPGSPPDESAGDSTSLAAEVTPKSDEPGGDRSGSAVTGDAIPDAAERQQDPSETTPGIEAQLAPAVQTVAGEENTDLRQDQGERNPSVTARADDGVATAHPIIDVVDHPTMSQAPATDIIAITGDITETVDRADALAEVEPHDAALTPAAVDRLDAAVLIHSGDDLHHANPAFLALTGYHTLQDLRVEGGIDALFVGEDEGIVDVPPGAVMMIRNDGRLVPVTARLQAIRFDDKGIALMMSLALASLEDVPAAPPMPEPVMAPVIVPEPVPVEDPSAGPNIAEVDTPLPADTTDLRDAEMRIDALRIETEELRAILETATDGVVVMGEDGDIRSLNRSANALFNYNDADVIGKPFATLFAHESQRAVMDYLAGLSGHGVASVLNDGREVIGREASGGFIPLFMTMGRLSSSSGYCAVIRDITQWKRTEEELRSAKRAAETANAHKSDFLARVSHEIRTPLNAIIGFSDMMASEHFGPIGSARYIEYASDIGRSGRHVLDIVNDLLDISKIEAGEMELEFAAVELNEAVSEAVSLVQPQANAQRVIIRTSLSTAVPNVVADNRSIKQMALNILANAIRFTPAGGQIVVSTAYEANGSVMLRIRDTGVGMTRTELEQAIKPFRQVTTGVRKRGEGTGLGLPLTKAMAEANRALFAIHSAPNEGTLVEITFPSQRVLAN